ncbi:hypothetical protein [Flintibacter porci]|uniref:hypothetical protein n=1 Tax=Flintibacter porci TaxID=3342383 RepID=UPI003F8948D4
MAYGTVNVGQAQAENNNYLTNEQVGVAGGLATLDGNGKLTESQRPVIDAYTKSQTDGKIEGAVDAHDASPTAHSDIRGTLATLEASVEAIELKFGANVTENPFTVTFATLNDVVVTGVWNTAQARIEF